MKFKKLATKLIACISGIVLVVCVGLAVLSYTIASNALTTATDDSLQKISANGAAKIAERLNSYLQELKGLSDVAEFQDIKANKAEIIALMGRIVKSSGYINMFVADASGNTYTYQDQTTSISDREYFQTAVKGTATVSDPIVSKVDNSLQVMFAVPLKNASGAIIGVLAAARDGMVLSEMIKDITYAKTGNAFIINSKGVMIGHTNTDLVIKMDNNFENVKTDSGLASIVALETKMIKGEEGIGSYSYQGVKKFMGYSPVDGTTWSLALAAPESEVFAEINTLAIIIIIISIVFIVISVIAAVVIAGNITKPVKKALIMINEMNLGHFNMRLRASSIDEIGSMSNTMDTLADSLQNVVIGTMKQIAAGDVSAQIAARDDKDEIGPALALTISSIRALVVDANMLAKAAIEGKLEARADAGKHGGDFAKIVEGFNHTLDAVIKPVQEASSVLQDMSAGNLKKRMVGDYQGDHADIKNALNGTLDSLEGYVNEIADTLTEMANSNMAVNITGDYKGDFMPIKEALNLIIESFNQILSDMNNAADQVAAGSRQVSDGSQELSQGATEQASAIEELTSSIGDIAAKTKQNAMRANEASELAISAKEQAEKGNTQMQALQKAMEEINLSSANISKIIKVIDDIAFQTNILALNAAVEAARAGQHGKGFAVVAEEVRNLAARSANAANETTGLIEGSIHKVSAGTTIADGTAKALEQIVTEVTKAASLVGSIAEASNEQANNITQINQGVEQVSQVVQSNSATAEQSAAASEELSSQADLLKEMISQFQLKDKIGTRASNRLSDDFLPVKKDEGMTAERKSPAKNKPKTKQTIALTNNEFGKY